MPALAQTAPLPVDPPAVSGPIDEPAVDRLIAAKVFGKPSASPPHYSLDSHLADVVVSAMAAKGVTIELLAVRDGHAGTWAGSARALGIGVRSVPGEYYPWRPLAVCWVALRSLSMGDRWDAVTETAAPQEIGGGAVVQKSVASALQPSGGAPFWHF